MKKGLVALSVLGMLVFGVVGNASALLIDFEDLTTRNNFYYFGIESTYQGFSWSPAGSSTGWASATTSQRVVSETIVPVSGSSYAWNWNGPQSLFIDFGAPMTVNSAYFADLGSNYSANSETVQLFGYDNSHTLTETSGILSLTDSFQLLESGFGGAVYSLEIRADRHSWFLIDDIALNEATAPKEEPVIPEPATLVLFGSGLVGTFLRRRKKA